MLTFFFLPVLADGESAKAVVSIRQYQEVGPSNIHLYFYTLDGKLVRQLTDTPGLDDVLPMFDRAGQSVLFFRQASTPDLKAKEGYYVLNLNTNKLVRLSPEETRFQENHREPTLQPVEFSWPSDKAFQTDIGDGNDVTSCQSPDGAYQLVRKPNPAYSESDMNADKGGPFLYFLRTKGSSECLSLASLPGYQTYFTPDDYLELRGSPFVLFKDSAALFMTRHMDSTTGNALWVLDLKAKRWTEISVNAGLLYFVSGQSSVTLLHSSRYEALGKSGLAVNCGYLEFWDATFHAIRLGPATSLFHGAAIYYGPGQILILHDPEYGS